jgi:hypothetical protein
MPRTVAITLSPSQTDGLITEIQRLEGLVGLRVQRGISVQPPGDVVSVEVLNRALPSLMRLLDAQSIGRTAAGSITTSEPTSLISASSAEAIMRDSNEATWEEMEAVIAKETNMTVNTLLLMGACGILAVIGIATNALHLVIAAMVLAPVSSPLRGSRSASSPGVRRGGGASPTRLWGTVPSFWVQR